MFEHLSNYQIMLSTTAVGSQLLVEDTYGLTDYRAFERVVDEYKSPVAKAEKVKMPPSSHLILN